MSCWDVKIKRIRTMKEHQFYSFSITNIDSTILLFYFSYFTQNTDRKECDIYWSIPKLFYKINFLSKIIFIFIKFTLEISYI